MSIRKWFRVGLFGVIMTGSVGLRARAASTFVVGMYSYAFSPSNILINPGDSILWTNTVSLTHDTTQGTPSTPATNRLWASALLALGDTFRFVFTNVGEYPYMCKRHVVDMPQPTNGPPTQTGLVMVTTANLPPTVNITNPINNATFNLITNFTINATATDPNGAVDSVQFYSDTTLLGTDTSSPYSIVVSNLSPGSHALTAVAVDNLGLATTSAPVTVRINTIITTNSVTVADFSFTPSNITIVAGSRVVWARPIGTTSHTVTGAAGSLEPLCGPGVLITGTLRCTNRFMTPGVYSYFCSIHPTLMQGTVTVLPSPNTPSVTLDTPANGAAFVTNSFIVIQATASDPSGIANVEFFRAPNTSLGSAAAPPFSVSTGPLAAGNYSVFAKATSGLGFGALSPQANFSVVVPAELRLVSPMLSGGGSPQFDLTTTPGLTYVVEQTPELPTGWSALSTNVATGETFRVVDPNPLGAQRFYRAFIQP